MKMKTLIFLFVGLTSTLFAFQTTIEPEIGYISSQQIIREDGGAKAEELNARQGVKLGVGLRFDLPGRHSFKTGVYYAEKGGSFTDADNNESAVIDVNWVEVPFTVLTQIGKSKFSLTYGLYTAFVLDGAMKTLGTSYDITSDLKQDYGYSLGLRYDAKNSFYGFQVQDSLADIFSGSLVNIKQQAFTISAGIKF